MNAYSTFDQPTALYTLAALPYPYDALEPYIDTKTMEFHHTKHQQAYIDNLNNALMSYPELQQFPLVHLLQHLQDIPEQVRTAIRNNGGGNLNHALFWPMMKKNGGGKPHGKIGDAITKRFKSFEAFQDSFNTAAKSVFGSGWAWLAANQKGDLEIVTTHNQDTPFSDKMFPILGLDVWEHAYYFKYQNRRPDYINAWWHVINWDQIEQNWNFVR